MAKNKFTTCLNCIDGEVQLPVIDWIENNFEVDYVNMITEPGMARVLSAEDDIEFIFQKLFSSLNDYNHIKQIFIVGHPNCTGNKIDNQKHIQQVKKAAQKVRERFPDNLIVSLWVSDKSIVEKII